MYFHPLLFRKLSLSHMVLGGSFKLLSLTQINCQHHRKGSSNIQVVNWSTPSWLPGSWVITLMCSYLIFYKQKYLWPNTPWEMQLSGQSPLLLPHHIHYDSPITICFSSAWFSGSVMSNSLRLHGLQHTRLTCPSPTPEVCSNSCSLSQ